MKKRTYICLCDNFGGKYGYSCQILSGLNKRARARGEKVITVFSVAEAVAACVEHEEQCVIMMLSTAKINERVCHELRQKDIHIIMANTGYLKNYEEYSVVEEDYHAMGYHMVGKLMEDGKKSLLCVGFNPNSYHDEIRLSGIHSFAEPESIMINVIENNGDMLAVCKALKIQMGEFDAIVFDK